MASIIIRYGTLLALFLIAVETAKRSYILRLTDLELYLGLVAIAFLTLGILLALKIRNKQDRQEQDKGDKELSVLDRANFSERELDVLLFLCHGYTNKEISDQLGITSNTVKTHLKNIYGKLDVSNRTQAAAEAQLLKIVG